MDGSLNQIQISSYINQIQERKNEFEIKYKKKKKENQFQRAIKR